jgi:glycosyltransferase involved in cell wall biosynthesis
MQYSIVVPIYFDGYLAPALCAEVQRVMSQYLGLPRLGEALELIFVNDGSTDGSLQTLLELRNTHDFVRVIDLSRNFGQHQAIACGLREARGQVVLRMNVDMQDPPSEIPRLLDAMKEGDLDLVVGQYVDRKHPPMVRLTALVYYRLFRTLTGFESPQNTSPLRAMSRRFVDAYNGLTERSRFPQGLDQWLGFRRKYITTQHQARVDNRSAYNFWSRSLLAINGVLSFSDRPLKLMTGFGFVAALVGFVTALAFVVARLADVGPDYLPGWVSLASIAMVAFGLQIAAVGVVGIYVGRIFSEVQNRPLYIVRDRFEQHPSAGSKSEATSTFKEHA